MDNDAVLRLALVDLSEAHREITGAVARMSATYTGYNRAMAGYRDCMDRIEALYRDTLAAMAQQPATEPSPETAAGLDIGDDEPKTGDDDATSHYVPQSERDRRPFRPSEVVLDGVPLVGAMGDSHLEHGAALLCAAMAGRGDTWAPVLDSEVGAMMDEAIRGGCLPWARWERIGGAAGDYMGRLALSEYGAESRGMVRFTESGIEALRRYVGVER